MGKVIKGDADDYVLEQFGIPSITAEIGSAADYLDDWLCKNEKMCFSLLNDNYQWVLSLLQSLDIVIPVLKGNQ